MSSRAEHIDHTVVLCTGSDCWKKGARRLKKVARDALKEAGCGDSSLVVTTKCCGLCKQAPVVCVDGAEWIAKVKPKTLRREIARAALHRDSQVA